MCHSQAGFSIPTPTVTYTPLGCNPEVRQLEDNHDNCIKSGVIKERMSLYQRVMKFFRDRAKEGDW